MAALPNENEGYPREEIYGGTLDAEPCYEDMDDDDFAVQHSLDPSRPNGRRGRPRRDPTEPRKPVAASLFYVAERKKELIKAQAGTAPLAPDSLSMTAMTAQAKEEWRNLDNQLRAPYQEKARRDRERYELEMASYVKPEAGQSVANELTERMVTKMGRLKKDPQRPKHPRSAYFYYLEINRQRVMEENPAMSVPDVTRTLAEGWRGLSEADKVSYEEKASADRVRFEDEMKVYEPSETYKASKEKYGEQKRMKAEAKAHQGVGSSSLARMAADTPYGVQFTKGGPISSEAQAAAALQAAAANYCSHTARTSANARRNYVIASGAQARHARARSLPRPRRRPTISNTHAAAARRTSRHR